MEITTKLQAIKTYSIGRKAFQIEEKSFNHHENHEITSASTFLSQTSVTPGDTLTLILA
jgi:hypothetical protein